MRNRGLPAHIAFLVLIQAASCSSSSMGDGSGGGPGASGGATNTGGAPAASGGNVGSGGAGTGGAPAANSGGRPGNGGAPVGSGGNGSGAGGATATGGGGGRSGAPSGGGPGTAGSGTGAGGDNGAAGLALIATWPNGAIISAVRGVTTPAPTQIVRLRNNGASPVMVTALTIGGTNRTAFQINGAPALPIALAGGAEMPLTVQVATSTAGLPTAPAQDSGGTLVIATLTATAGTASAQTNLFGIVLTIDNHEPTFGQILTTLGYKVNVGLALNNANPNGGTVQQLPKIEAGTDEIAAPLFVKAGTGNVTLVPLARYSPKGPMPFGWYPMGNPGMRRPVATMASVPDLQTSDKARMVLPPVTGSTSFDPGAGSFGIWTYTDQLSHLYDVPGAPTNGDYAYSEDAANSPANVHRTKVYPLKDAAGVTIPGSFLLGVEEAGNGDYQDFVYAISNVRVP